MKALPKTGTVFSDDGIQGQFEVEPPLQGEAPRVRVRFADGRQLWIAAAELIAQGEGRYRLPLALATLGEAVGEGGEMHVIPVVAETLQVTKRQVETASVRIIKRVHAHEKLIDVPVLRDEVEVQRVAVNRFVEQPVPVRTENETLILPLLEEVLVVEKRLLLKEELHIRRRQTTVRQPQTVVCRSEEVVVERFPYLQSQQSNESSQ